MEGFLNPIPTRSHALGANCDAALDRTTRNLICDVLHSFEPGAAETVHGGGGGGVWEASCKHRGPDNVGGLAVANLKGRVNIRQGMGTMAGTQLHCQDKHLQQWLD